MVYLSPIDYESYGLEATTPAAWISAASVLIEAHCRRPTLAIAQYTERLRVMRGRNTVRLTYLPLAPLAPATSALISVRARWSLGRRGEASYAPLLDELGYVQEVALAFGLPGAWTSVDLSTLDYDADTGELMFPLYALGLTFNEMEVTYTAGLAQIPDAVKVACAQLARNAQATPALNVRVGTLDRMHVEYFADTLLDTNVCALLAPYVAQKAG